MNSATPRDEAPGMGNGTMLALRGLLFDFDGVLINSLPVMKRAFSAALDEVYADSRPDHDALFVEYRKYLGMGFPEIMRQLGLSQDMYQPFRRCSRLLASQVQLYDGALDLLLWGRRQGLRMGIATGKDLERTLELLEQLGIRDFFGSVYASDNVGAPKPAPEMALRFAADNDLPPEGIILLGDAEADIRCGQAARCRTAAVSWGYGDAGTLRALHPTYVFDTPQDARAQLAAMLAACAG